MNIKSGKCKEVVLEKNCSYLHIQFIEIRCHMFMADGLWRLEYNAQLTFKNLCGSNKTFSFKLYFLGFLEHMEGPTCLVFATSSTF